MPYSLTLSILIPTFAIPLVLLLNRRGRKSAQIASMIAILFSLIALLVQSSEILSGRIVVEILPWLSVLNIQFGFMLDGLSLPIMVITAIVTFLILLFGGAYIDEDKKTGFFYAKLLLLYVGTQGVFAAADIFFFYLFWELTLIPAFLLLIFWSEPGIERAAVRKTGLKFFLYTHIGALFLLIGIIQVVVLAGTSSLIELPTALMNVGTFADLLRFAAIAMILGFSVKLGLVPLHSWLPDTYVHTPTPVSAIISGLMAKIGAYGLVRAISSWFPSIMILWTIPLSFIGFVSIVYGGYLAIGQSELKRLLAYSSISQAGYIFLGAVSVSVIGLGGAAFHIVNHAILKSLLFLCSGSFIKLANTSKLDDLRGFGRRIPITSSALLVGSLGLAGIPPLNGFVSEVLIFAGVFTVPGSIIIAIPAVLSVVLTFSYLLWLLFRLFVAPSSVTSSHSTNQPLSFTIPLVFLAFLAILLGFWPNLVLNPISQWIMTLTLGGS